MLILLSANKLLNLDKIPTSEKSKGPNILSILHSFSDLTSEGILLFKHTTLNSSSVLVIE